MTEKTNKQQSLTATNLGPRPGDFPVGSMQSRAAARAQLDRFEEDGEGMCMIDVHDCPKPTQDQESEGPLGQVVYEGKLYEVYESRGRTELYRKAGSQPPRTVRLPRCTHQIFVHFLGEDELDAQRVGYAT
jgi:hypothetical protein